MPDMSERTYERRCESCIHFVPFPESEEFDICMIQGSSYEIYRELPYDKCTAYIAGFQDEKPIDSSPCPVCERMIQNAGIIRVRGWHNDE